jgi:hypothetical protein
MRDSRHLRQRICRCRTNGLRVVSNDKFISEFLTNLLVAQWPPELQSNLQMHHSNQQHVKARSSFTKASGTKRYLNIPAGWLSVGPDEGDPTSDFAFGE